VLVPERGLEDRRENRCENDRQWQRQGERREKGGNTLADTAGNDLLVNDDHDRDCRYRVGGRRPSRILGPSMSDYGAQCHFRIHSSTFTTS
jgi:hypothetical protein